MSSYSSEIITVGDTPVGFDEKKLYPTGRNIPHEAVFIVKGSSIRISASAIPEVSNEIGLLASAGDIITVTGEHDIKNLKMVSNVEGTTSTFYVEFFNELN